MRILLTAFFVLSLTTAAEAKEVFKNTELKDIKIVEIKDGKATVSSPEGKEAELAVGDSLGKESGKVTEMRSTFITIETGTTKTRIPAAFRLEQ